MHYMPLLARCRRWIILLFDPRLVFTKHTLFLRTACGPRDFFNHEYLWGCRIFQRIIRSQLLVACFNITSYIHVKSYSGWHERQCIFFSRNIGAVTPNVDYYYYYLNKCFPDQNIQKKTCLVLKTEALMSGCIGYVTSTAACRSLSISSAMLYSFREVRSRPTTNWGVQGIGPYGLRSRMAAKSWALVWTRTNKAISSTEGWTMSSCALSTSDFVTDHMLVTEPGKVIHLYH